MPLLALPNTDDGKGHFACNLHYYTGGLDSLAHAQALADKCDIVIGEADLAATNDFGTWADDMVTRNADILNVAYGRTADSTSAAFPSAYYAKDKDGIKVSIGTRKVMQPDALATYNDPRGFSGASWKDWRAKDGLRLISDYNTAYGANSLRGLYLDAAHASTFKGVQVKPATTTPYLRSEWVDLVRSVGDAAVAADANTWVLANLLLSAGAYLAGEPPTRDGLAHVLGGLAEGWIRANYDPLTSYPSEATLGKAIDMMIDAQSTLTKRILVQVNIGNAAIGSAPAGWSNPSAAALDQWKRYGYCAYLIGNRGKAWYEFVKELAEKPWDETHAYYSVNLGVPLDTAASWAATKSGSVGMRRYTSGVVLLSATGGSVTADRNYIDPVSSATYATGSTISIGPNTGLLLTLGSAPPAGNPAAPVHTLLAPLATVTPPSTALVRVRVQDADGIGAYYMKLDGDPLIIPSVDSSGGVANIILSHDFGLLSAGDHTVETWTQDAHTPGADVRETTSRFIITVAAAPPLTGAGPGADAKTITVSSDVNEITTKLRLRGIH